MNHVMATHALVADPPERHRAFDERNGKTMETALWIAQGLLATIFLLTGATKLTQPRVAMAAGPMTWAADVSDTEFRTIGVLELLGAAGLLLPGALDVAPVVTPLAAAGSR